MVDVKLTQVRHELTALFTRFVRRAQCEQNCREVVP